MSEFDRLKAQKDTIVARQSASIEVDGCRYGEHMIRAMRIDLEAAQSQLSTTRAALAEAERERDEARTMNRFQWAHVIAAETAERIAAFILGGEMANLAAVDLTDPHCPRGTALTIAAEAIRANAWRSK